MEAEKSRIFNIFNFSNNPADILILTTKSLFENDDPPFSFSVLKLNDVYTNIKITISRSTWKGAQWKAVMVKAYVTKPKTMTDSTIVILIRLNYYFVTSNIQITLIWFPLNIIINFDLLIYKLEYVMSFLIIFII